MNRAARVVAFYLPQFHPIPENDEWWGAGFTEWTNTAKANPLFPGHYQPHIPQDLGFYDLRVPETRVAQAELARDYGVEAFCYYHYWFAGRRILERPFNEVLESGEPDFPFCLCWANETWTGIWHGTPNKILIEQTYPGLADHEAHFYTLLKAFTDKRYMTVDGKPIFLVYKPANIPDIERVTDFWRALAEKEGLPGLYLVGVAHNTYWDPRESGFDAAVTQRLPALDGRIPWRFFGTKLRKLLGRKDWKLSIYIHDEKLTDYLIRSQERPYKDFPCLIPNWDNTPRSAFNGLVLHGSTPELFARQVRRALGLVADEPTERKLVFLKAWNEWAEGNHMEPDRKYGRAYLEALKQEICVC